jgi:hypothetical protein
MTSATARYANDLIEAIGHGWNRFWFTPIQPRGCAALRIAVGAITLAHLLSLQGDLGRWYARDGLLPPDAVQAVWEGISSGTPTYHYSYLGLLLSGTEQTVAHFAALAAALAFLLGLFPRATGFATLVAVLAYIHRAPLIVGHLEPVLAYLLFYLCIAPSGSDWSLNGWLKRKRSAVEPVAPSAPPTSVSANMALRLIQVHTAMFVAMMGLSKLYGDAWWDGGAIWLLLAQTESRPLDLTAVRSAGLLGEYFLNLCTHAVVYFELAFPILIWNRQARPLLLLIGAVIWLALALATGQLLFALALITASFSFVPAANGSRIDV